MEEIRTKILYALIEKSAEKNALLELVPKKNETFPLFDQKELVSSFFQIDDLHFSWFQKTLSSCSEQEKTVFFSLFESEQRKQFMTLMNFKGNLLALSPIKKKLAIFQLKKRARLIAPIPKPLLAKSELNDLFTLPMQQIYELIDFLGIFDLSLYLKHVVSKTFLSKIAASLTKKQMTFLQFINKQPTRVIPQKMQLNLDQLDPASLNRMIHKMGLYRLAGALAFESQEFLWHFLHKLDTGRAAILEKKMQTKEPGLSKFFRKQVLMLIKRIKNG